MKALVVLCCVGAVLATNEWPEAWKRFAWRAFKSDSEYQICSQNQDCVSSDLCFNGFYNPESQSEDFRFMSSRVCGPTDVRVCCSPEPFPSDVTNEVNFVPAGNSLLPDEFPSLCDSLAPGSRKYLSLGCGEKRKKRSTLDALVAEVEAGKAEPPKPVVAGAAATDVKERRGYQPPRLPVLPECGIEYDCVPWFACDENGYIITDGSQLIDIRQRNQTEDTPAPAVQEKSATVEYRGGFGYVPDATCTLIDPEYGAYVGEPSRCCHKPPLDLCIGGESCIDGWHCPHHDGSPFLDLRYHPRACVSGGPYAVCCEPRALFPPVPRVCGVRNPDGIRPLPALSYDELDVRILDPPNSPLQLNEAKFAEFPWQALLFKNTPAGFQFLSGGVLITDRHILTAAHYVHNLNPVDLQVRLGEWEVNTLREPMEYQDYYVAKVFIHPEYKPGPEYNDLAILVLSDSVYITNNVHTACLPAIPLQKFDGSRCVATGWGKNAFEGNYQQVLKKVDLPIVPWDKCQAALRTTRLTKHFRLHPNFICAGGELGKDACTGDGGGPLVCPVEGQWVVAGITSWGIGCGEPGIPGVYASVSAALPWIDTILKSNAGVRYPPLLGVGAPYPPGYLGRKLDAPAGDAPPADEHKTDPAAAQLASIVDG